MTDLISANDLHEAADSELMMGGGSAKEAMARLGVDVNAIRDFLKSSNFHYPDPDGIPDNLDKWSAAYGIALGIAVSKLKADD